MRRDRAPIFAVLLGACALPAAGCCVPSYGDDTACEAKLRYTGKNASGVNPFKGYGSGDTKSAALDNACWSYCAVADSSFDSSWQASAASDEYESKLEWSTSSHTEGALRQKFEACISNCMKEIRTGSDAFTAERRCGVPSSTLESHKQQWSNYQ